MLEPRDGRAQHIENRRIYRIDWLGKMTARTSCRPAAAEREGSYRMHVCTRYPLEWVRAFRAAPEEIGGAREEEGGECGRLYKLPTRGC